MSQLLEPVDAWAGPAGAPRPPRDSDACAGQLIVHICQYTAGAVKIETS